MLFVIVNTLRPTVRSVKNCLNVNKSNINSVKYNVYNRRLDDTNDNITRYIGEMW